MALAQSAWHPQQVGKARAGGAAGSTMVRVIADGTKVQMGSVVQQYQRYLMDTGSGGSVSFTSGAVAEFAFEKIEGKRYLADMTQAGIGDTIIAINDRDVHDYTWDEEEALHKAPRHELDIITAQGQKKHVVLESKEYW